MEMSGEEAVTYLPFVICSGLVVAAAATLAFVWFFSHYYYNFTAFSMGLWSLRGIREDDKDELTVSSILRSTSVTGNIRQPHHDYELYIN